MNKFASLRTAFLVLAPASLALAACSQADAPAELPHGTVQQMMANEVQPTADIYWAAVKFESRLEPDGSVVEEEFEPETEAEWAELVEAARKLQALGQSLQTPAYSDTRGDDWNVFANGLVEASQRAEQAALDKDPDAVFEVGGTVYNVCKACHQMYPPAEFVDAAGT